MSDRCGYRASRPHIAQAFRGRSDGGNHQSSGAKAILHATFDFSMREYRNLYDSLNDRGKSITLAA